MGVCYACSISCHGEHELVELFSKRDFVCDCGTTRVSSGAECRLRYSPQSVVKGVRNEQPAEKNKYGPNFRNIFCGCQRQYEPEKEKCTMFQCLGIGSVEDGGCGEDWWHPECLVGSTGNDGGRVSDDKENKKPQQQEDTEEEKTKEETEEEEDLPLPAGFPNEEDFETFICYKCVNANPWLKQYAGTPGFLPPVYKQECSSASEGTQPLKKRKLEDDDEENRASKQPKSSSSPPRPRNEEQQIAQQPEKHDNHKTTAPKHASLPQPAPSGTFSLFLKENFRDHFCRCASCYPDIVPHRQLLEEEDTYEPPLSENNDDADNASTDTAARTGSLYERGQAALSNMDRVHAIEGVMAYQHLRDKVKDFLKPYAESGKVVSAEDIKAYFEELRGDDMARRFDRHSPGDGGGEGDYRREQSGY